MTSQDFQTLQNVISSISKKEKIDESRAFIHWVLTSYYDLEAPELYENIVDSGEDKRIDSFVAYEQDRLVLIQAKYFSNSKKVISEKDVALFYSCLSTLKNPSQLQIKSPLLNISELYKEIWQSDGEIELHYFTTGTFDKSALKERITFNNLPEYSGRIQIYFHNLEDILNTLRTNMSEGNPLINEQVEFPIIANQYFRNNSGAFPSLICSIPADYLTKLYKKYSNSLFDSNIRFYKGSKSGTINSKIIETVGVKKERKNFWYYNNGVTVVCRALDLDDADEDNLKLVVTGPQIINGCQTTVSLFEASEKYYKGKIPLDVNLIVRFIQANPKDTDLITLYTNSQNPVSAYQLRSNDPIQKKIKEDLENYPTPYFYETKEGERRFIKKTIKTKFNNRVIDMVQTAQAIYSALHDPAYARRYKKNLFSDHYSKIFKKDISVHEVLLPNLVLNEINDHIKEFKNNEFSLLKSDGLDETKKKDISSKEFLLYSNLIYLYFIWALIHKKYGRYDSNIASKLINNQLKDRVKRAFNYITSVLKYYRDLQLTNPQRFLKNIKNIELLRDELFKEIDKDISTGNDRLKEFFPNI